MKKYASLAIALYPLQFSPMTSAQEFYWTSFSYVGTHASPTAGCIKNLPSTNPQLLRLRYSHTTLTPGDGFPIAKCWAIQSYWQDNFATESLRDYDLLFRSGDTCPQYRQYNPTTGECSNDEQKGPDSINSPALCSTQDSSIKTSIGNNYIFREELQESGLNAPLQLHYNSIDSSWQHSYSTRLRTSSEKYIALIKPTGQEEIFLHNENDTTPTDINSGTLTKNSSGWTYKSRDNKDLHFDSNGRLIAQNSISAHITLSYLDNKITITDQNGRVLVITQSVDRRILSAQAGTQIIDYTYSRTGQLIEATRRANGVVTSSKYSYEDPHNVGLLTGITDERGVRYATWTYDDQGRAISSEHAGGAERTLVSYNADGSSTVTNALGKRTTYRFQTVQGIRRITAIEGEPSANCPNSNSSFTYDDRGLVKTRTDNKGNVTTFDYNERGLEVSRTEAFGTPQARTVTTTWHPTLFLPATVTEPDRITTYSYDDQGRPLSQSVSQR
ncbi:RHS repeat protein [Pseudomonas sp. zfem005]|uniref:RHS repeat protein n=1 Tax=Pseudomonas sp. zfem005 TaxID=3078200 RepID=UPI0029281C21|nr:RHS repeat protein [Pseudomonas sp. zfem005]MDU9413267.1 RHS repeat protein [Pseudomonas sp. zfem005]